MTRDETVALFEACEAARAAARAAALGEGKSEDDAEKIAHEAAKAHWNAWAEARLAERKALEADGRWAAEKQPWGSLEPKNEETRAWMEAAAADFSRCLFLVKGAEGTKETAGEVKEEDRSAEAGVKSIQLEADRIDLDGFVFPGDAWFESATFSGDASFESATFSGNASFESATFSGDAWFESATFSGNASFESATFSGTAWFKSATFSGDASFESATFSGTASFASATFSGDAWFESATFSDTAWFASATFSGTAWFKSATFSGTASFESATFSGTASFASATFSGTAWFKSATFSGTASFESATFKRDSFFRDVRFGSAASFALCDFCRHASFEASRFGADASFQAIKGDRGFNMADAVFNAVPDFIQAHFEEAPRLDNLEVGRKLPALKYIADKEREKLGRRGRWHRRRLEKNPRYRRAFEAAVDKNSDLRNIPARWRALKRLAIQGHDTERELEFHARELRSQRFTEDWPLPLAFWRARAWVGFFRFVFGIFYELFSDFGRSLARPAAFWIAAVVIGAVVYAGQSPEMAAARHRQEAKGASAVSATASRAWHAWLADRQPCFAGNPAPKETKEEAEKRESLPGKPAYIPPPYVGALSPDARAGTDLANEAWHLAFRNAFVVLDSSSDAAHRTYGCLYGVEMYGGSNPAGVVPSAVSTASAVQKLFSALMIFLFGLALRNMLKMK